jgi:IS30 family transposase
MTLTKEQIQKIHELFQKHSSPAHVYWQSRKSRTIEVEFEFPYRYVIGPKGKIARDVF